LFIILFVLSATGASSPLGGETSDSPLSCRTKFCGVVAQKERFVFLTKRFRSAQFAFPSTPAQNLRGVFFKKKKRIYVVDNGGVKRVRLHKDGKGKYGLQASNTLVCVQTRCAKINQDFLPPAKEF